MRQFGTIDVFDTFQFGPLTRLTHHDSVILTHLVQHTLAILTHSVHINSVPLTHLTQSLAQGFDLWDSF